jgi:hypothetical protein
MMRGWLALLLMLLVAVEPQAANQSAMSRWLSDSTPKIRELLVHHPRFQGQPVQLVRVDHNGLAEALVTLLTTNLQNREGISLVAAEKPQARPLVLPARIDDLDCGALDEQHLRLLVSVTTTDGRAARARLTLVEPGNGSELPLSWQWQGTLSRVERGVLAQAPTANVGDGSLDAPWREGDVELAAMQLHRQLACSLRPQVKTRLGLQWQDTGQLAPLFADTANRSRHLLGNYLELAFSETDTDFVLTAELTPFREDVWQLWVNGSPGKPGLAPVQAVAYFRAESPRSLVRAKPPVRVATPPSAPTPPPPDRGTALDYLNVEMIDAWQGRARSGKAELQVKLRLVNRSDWPIDYAFIVSGGHYQHCVPEPGHYRHDRYGKAKGRVEPGQSLVTHLVVDKAQHRPNPWMGARKCAGFRSLEGFKDYTAKGYTVTDYVRWGS